VVDFKAKVVANNSHLTVQQQKQQFLGKKEEKRKTLQNKGQSKKIFSQRPTLFLHVAVEKHYIISKNSKNNCCIYIINNYLIIIYVLFLLLCVAAALCLCGFAFFVCL